MSELDVALASVADVSGLETSRVLDDAARRAIDRGNALALFPRFATQSGSGRVASTAR
jgi:hypothetical protein